IISYEEYHPFGTTSYRAGRNETETSLKRYRYVGKERDEETGLYYYGARYYAPWLQRFISTDPLKDEYPQLNPYNYADNSPVTDLDIDGQQNTRTPKRSVRGQVRQRELANRTSKAPQGSSFVEDAIIGAVETLVKGAVNVLEFGFDRAMQNPRVRGYEIARSQQPLEQTVREFEEYNQQGIDLVNPAKIVGRTGEALIEAGQNVVEGIQTGDGRQFGQGAATIGEAAFGMKFLFKKPKVGAPTKLDDLHVTQLTNKRALAGQFLREAQLEFVDFNKAVLVKTLKEGDELIQFRMEGLDGGISQRGTVGSFFAPKGTTPGQIGLDPDLVVQTLHVKVTRATEVLETTHKSNAPFYADPSRTTEGGGIQLFSRELKKNVEVTNYPPNQQ
uniref:RHS repeat-associated core domain-containing protein n=1 Tax=Reichenbachiella versicolor TaxID=1821036 RepID=UPI0013A5A2A9